MAALKEEIRNWFNKTPHDMGKEEFDALMKIIENSLIAKSESVAESPAAMAGSTDLALEIINHAATMGCKCQSTGPDVDKNKHWPLCIVGKAQIYLGQKVSIQGGL